MVLNERNSPLMVFTETIFKRFLLVLYIYGAKALKK